jgi:hypothetical protein
MGHFEDVVHSFDSWSFEVGDQWEDELGIEKGIEYA